MSRSRFIALLAIVVTLSTLVVFQSKPASAAVNNNQMVPLYINRQYGFRLETPLACAPFFRVALRDPLLPPIPNTRMNLVVFLRNAHRWQGNVFAFSVMSKSDRILFDDPFVVIWHDLLLKDGVRLVDFIPQDLPLADELPDFCTVTGVRI